MWDLGNRDIIVLVSVISGWVIILNIFGTYLGFVITFVLAVCGWFTYIVADDTLLTPHAHLALDYIGQAFRELNTFLTSIYKLFSTYTTSITLYIRHLYRVYISEKMAQRRRSTYQLSSETRGSTKNPSRFSLVDGLSPIPKATFRLIDNSSNLENNPYAVSETRTLDRANSLGQITSTPLLSWKKEEERNGGMFGSAERKANDKNLWKKSQSFVQNHTLSRGEESTYSHEGSPWGTSISPKMRPRAAGVKTVQTVAGPLLASTRYNIDPKVYADVTSPGLTSRLTRYATEANAKLTHQSQYGTGQFPRVNLNSSPTPMISTKTGKMRMPVTVRVAPPESTRYSPPERKQILSGICHAESKSSPSVVQVLREISLKRHASREDVTFELAKKQRTEAAVFSDGLENLEEMTQKRARDDSSRSEEEASPINKALRPAKRSKTPSCHDILSSLSSSIGVSSGVKRKAIDVSRSGTPDVGKHFKSLDSSHGDGSTSQALSRAVSEPTKPNKRLSNESETRISDVQSPNKKSSLVHNEDVKLSSSVREIDENACGNWIGQRSLDRRIPKRDLETKKENITAKSSPAIKLTDKLFMKAEPENIEKIKTLIEEHGSTKPRFFTADSTEEIKKSDIVNMRQTSMKNRLKSMFDAISGKATNKINPEVVIQAEEKSTTSQSHLASLSSTTSTTNVNTSPIATSAIVPIIAKTKPITSPAKHVTFQLSNNETTSKSHETPASVTSPAAKSSGSELGETASPKNLTPADKTSAQTIFTNSNPTTSSTSFPLASSMFTNSSNQPASPREPSALQNRATIASNLPSGPASISATTTLIPQLNSQIFNSPPKSSVFQPPAISSSQSSSESPAIFSTKNSEMNSPPGPNFSFGTSKALPSAPSAQSLSFAAKQTPETSVGQVTSSSGSGLPTVTSASAGLFAGFGTTTNAASSDSTSFNTANSGGMFNGNSRTAENRGFTFGASTAVSAASPGTTAASTAPSTIFQAPVFTATSQPPTTNSPGATTTASSAFHFSTSNAPSMFGTPSTSTTTPSSGFSSSASTMPAFKFGTNPTTASANTQPGFSYATSPATAGTAATSSSTVPALSFPSTSNSTVIAFGGSSTTSSAATTQSNIFGAPTTTTTSSAATTQSNIFGAPTTTTTPMTSQPSLFGAPPTTSAPTITGSRIFGGPATSSTAIAPSTGSSGFGTTRAQTSTFSAPSSTSSSFGTPKTMESPIFGGLPPPSFSATPTSSSLFGSVNTEATPPTSTALPSFATGFGQKSPPPFGANPSPAGTPNFSSNTPGNTSSLFSSQPTEPFGATFASSRAATASGPYNFSNSSATASFGTPSTAPPAFGATNTSTTSFGATTTANSGFGSNNTTTLSFGAINSSAGTIGNPNATSRNFNGPNGVFGAATTAPPNFSNSVTASSTGFGSSATSNAFGNSSNNPPPAFNNSTASFTSFGATTNAASSFGQQNNSATSSFGTPTANSNTGFSANTNNNTANTTFTFGASQPTAQPAQQNAVFSFGAASSTSGNNPPSGSTPFQFGAGAPQTGGFNFTGAPTTPAINFSKDGAAGGSFSLPTPGTNSFNAPPSVGGMFSIGSGSTASRSRPSRRRQR